MCKMYKINLGTYTYIVDGLWLRKSEVLLTKLTLPGKTIFITEGTVRFLEEFVQIAYLSLCPYLFDDE